MWGIMRMIKNQGTENSHGNQVMCIRAAMCRMKGMGMGKCTSWMGLSTKGIGPGGCKRGRRL